MSTNEKFIKITDLKVNNNHDALFENCIDIYQVQAIEGKSFVTIRKVGKMVSSNDILIKKFSIYNDHNCYIISKLYSLENIKELHNDKIFPMVRVNICDKNNTVICSLSFNFHSGTTLNSSNDITPEGHFTITLHHHNKYTILKQLDAYCGHDQMMTLLTEWLLDDQIHNLIFADTKMNAAHT
jgi:hypothetical protein